MGLIWITFRPCFSMYLALMPFGSEEVMYLLILCVLISWPVIIIFFMLFCSYLLQMAGGLWYWAL